MKRKNRILPQSVADQVIRSEREVPSSFLLYCVTWNLAAKYPSLNDLSYLLPSGYDIYVISSQECGQSISASFLSRSIIPKWISLLNE